MARRWTGPATGTVLVLGMIASAGAARADDGLGLEGTARYVLAGDGSPVSVTQTVTATNELAPRAGTEYYWDAISIWLPTTVTDLSARAGTRALTVERVTRGGHDYARVRLPRRLVHGQSQSLTLRYRIPGSPPRSAGSARVGPGYAAFDVFSEGDSGRARIEIVSPAGMRLDLGLPHAEVTASGKRVATITGGGPTGLWTRLSLRDEGRKLSEQIRVGENTFTIEAWPQDDRWLAFQTSTVPKAIPILQELTGQPWPHDRATITEDASGGVYGWDGSYQGGRIAMDEHLDTGLLTHELAHAWANSATLGHRWLAEGLAQVLATRASERLGAEDEPHPDADPAGSTAFALNTWEAPDGRSASDADDYGYPASWRATTALFAGATAADFPDIVTRLTQRRTAYDGPNDRAWADASDWRQAYDLFELYAANPATEQIMRSWVLTDAEVAELADRASARRAYAALDAADGPALPPLRVRTPMARWDFAQAEQTIAATRALGSQLLSAQQNAEGAGLTLRAARAAYETATSASAYAALARELEQTEATLVDYRTVADEQRRPAGVFERVGHLVQPRPEKLSAAAAAIEAGDPGAARQRLRDLRAADNRAAWTGAATIATGMLLTASAIWLVLRRAIPRRRRDPLV